MTRKYLHPYFPGPNSVKLISQNILSFFPLSLSPGLTSNSIFIHLSKNQTLSSFFTNFPNHSTTYDFLKNFNFLVSKCVKLYDCQTSNSASFQSKWHSLWCLLPSHSPLSPFGTQASSKATGHFYLVDSNPKLGPLLFQRTSITADFNTT